MKLLKILCLVFIVVLFSACQPTTLDTVSPDGNLKITVKPVMTNSYGEIVFTVSYKGDSILCQSKLGIETEKQKFTTNQRIKSFSDIKYIVDDYRMITGKRSLCINKASERTYFLENDKGQILRVIFRVYNDGIAFKYNLDTIVTREHIIDEYTTYTIPRGTKRWMQQYDVSYECFFPMSTDGKLVGHPEVNLWGYPGLVEPRDSVFMLITEANIRRGHCGSLLYNGDNPDNYQVRLADNNMLMQASSWDSPWRLLIVGTLADVVESTLVTDVSDPSKVRNTEWINSGIASWIYWAYNHGTKDYQKVKDYTDLAADMKWPYTLIDWEWNEMGNGGNIQDAVKYALKKGVKPLMWYNSSTAWIGPGPLFRLNKKEDREREYKWLSDMGVAGIKVDFFSGDSVTTMNYFIDLLEDAVQYKLMLNFHGATLPRGWQRTYPHMMSVEGVYGAEWYNNNSMLTERAAEHNATLPFTRNVVGPMDYTPGTFSDSQYPHITSYSHELALPIIFESALQHMPDKPSVYYALPEEVRKLLSELPTSWDDTKLLSGYPGVEVVMARRKSDVWYIAGINGTDEARMLSVRLEELYNKGDKITLFSDGSSDKDIFIEKNIILSEKTQNMEIKCLPRGGFVMVLNYDI